MGGIGHTRFGLFQDGKRGIIAMIGLDGDGTRTVLVLDDASIHPAQFAVPQCRQMITILNLGDWDAQDFVLEAPTITIVRL